jgi:hypothetical protein
VPLVWTENLALLVPQDSCKTLNVSLPALMEHSPTLSTSNVTLVTLPAQLVVDPRSPNVTDAKTDICYQELLVLQDALLVNISAMDAA